MTYSEYRRSFGSTEEFLKEFGKLSYDEARAIVSADQAPTHIKAAMVGTWVCKECGHINPVSEEEIHQAEE